MVLAPPRSRVTNRSARRAERFQDGVRRLAGRDGRVLLRRLAELLRDAVPCHGLLLLRTDPTTVLPTDGVVEALPPPLCKPFWDNELLEPDYNKFVELARGPVAASLHTATGGELSRSHRYRTLYQPLGVTDELRVSFTGRDGSCWGIGQLVRTREGTDGAGGRGGTGGADSGGGADGAGGRFSAAERDLLAAAAAPVAAALRADLAVPAPTRGQAGARDGAALAGPALVVLDRAGEIDSITPEARSWLAELTAGSRTGMVPVPEPVYAVAGRARAARAGQPDAGPACAQVRTPTGGWLHLHASYLDRPDAPGDAVAVVITPAQPTDLVPLLALGYGLTHREQEVLRLLARGATTAELTRQLGISAHTVRDHIKALFGKVGVRSRAELVARIFAEHYFDRLEADVERL